MGSPSLALGFQSPWMLLGLLAGAVPIIIHLLRRRQYQQTEWAAMRFLLAAAKKHSRRVRFEQLLLLLVRTAIPISLAVALSQPYWHTPPDHDAPAEPTRRILVIDLSLSMSAANGKTGETESSFSRAISMAKSVIQQASQGDGFQLVVVRSSGPKVMLRSPSRRPATVLQLLERLKPTDEPADIPAALEAVRELLADSAGLSRHEVHFFSDWQRSNWLGDAAASRVRKLFDEIEHRAELVLFDCSVPMTQANLAVTRLTLGRELAIAGSSISVTAAVKNYGVAVRKQLPVELYLNSRRIGEQVVNLAEGEEKAVAFRVPIPAQKKEQLVVEHRLEVRIPADALARDNVRRAVLRSRRELQILLVNGKPAARPEDRASHYLAIALDPARGNQRQPSPFRVAVTSPRELSTEILRGKACVVLCNVPTISKRHRDLLEAYVAGGGGALVVVLGDRVDRPSYNRQLFADGKGLLPARLVEPFGRAKDAASDEFAILDQKAAASHNILEPFRGNPGSLSQLIAMGYVRAEPDKSRGVRTVINYSNGDPAIIENSFGEGRVVLVTTACERNWSVWPLSKAFPVLMQSIVRFATTGSEQQLAAGDPIARKFLAQGVSVPVELISPDGTSQKRTVESQDSALQVSFENTPRAGYYTIRLGQPLNREESFAVNTDAIESDLTSLSDGELRRMATGAVRITRWSPSAHRGTSAENDSLAAWFLFALVALLLAEQAMAWRFRLGFWLLLGFLASAAISTVFATPWDFALAAVVITAACAQGLRTRTRGG